MISLKCKFDHVIPCNSVVPQHPVLYRFSTKWLLDGRVALLNWISMGELNPNAISHPLYVMYKLFSSASDMVLVIYSLEENWEYSLIIFFVLWYRWGTQYERVEERECVL